MKTRDYSERLTIAAEQNTKERDFWLRQLAGEPVKTSFPYDFKSDRKTPVIHTADFQLTGEKEKQ